MDVSRIKNFSTYETNNCSNTLSAVSRMVTDAGLFFKGGPFLNETSENTVRLYYNERTAG